MAIIIQERVERVEKKGPYKAHRQSGGDFGWNVLDMRNGRYVSYPCHRKQCDLETATMNRAYAEAYAEAVAEGVEVINAIEAGEY